MSKNERILKLEEELKISRRMIERFEKRMLELEKHLVSKNLISCYNEKFGMYLDTTDTFDSSSAEDCIRMLIEYLDVEVKTTPSVTKLEKKEPLD